jgi:hypothetical protein
VLTIALFTVVFLKLLFISHSSGTTFLVLLRSAGAVEVIFGSAVLLVPGFAIAGIAAATAWERHEQRRLPQAISVGLFASVLLAISAPLLVCLAAVPLLVLAIFPTFTAGPQARLAKLAAKHPRSPVEEQQLGQLRRKIDRTKHQSQWIVAVNLALLAYLIVGDDTPWIPAETIELESGRSLVGYVISTEGPDLVVMAHDDRRVHRFPLEEVESRELCRVGNALRPMYRPYPRPHYPDCPGS